MFAEALFPVLDLAIQLKDWALFGQPHSPFRYDSIDGGGDILSFTPLGGGLWQVRSEWAKEATGSLSSSEVLEGIESFVSALKDAARLILDFDISPYVTGSYGSRIYPQSTDDFGKP